MDAALTLPVNRRRSLRRPIGFAAFALGLAAIVAYLAASFAVAERFTHAERHRVDRPPQVAATRYEDVALRTSDGVTLRGWYFPVAGDRAAILVHGRNGNRIGGERRTFEHIADFLIADGYSVLMFDLRGHGESDGDRYTLGLYERRDIAAAIEYVTARGVREERIALIGVSMGAGSVLQSLTLHPNVGAVIADSSYTDARQVVGEKLEYVAGVPNWLTPGAFLTMRMVFGIDGDQIRPIDAVRAHPERAFLFIHGDTDEFVEPHHATELRAASANAASELWFATGCQHAWAYNDHPAEWENHVRAFLDREIAR